MQGATLIGMSAAQTELSDAADNPSGSTDSTSSTSPSAPKKKRGVKRTTGWYVVFAVVAGVVAGALSLLFNQESRAALGISDPGLVTTVGMPLAKSGGEVLAALATGSFMLAAFGTKARKDGSLSLDGWAASRVGGWASICWGLIALLQIPMTLSDVSGQPLATTLQPAYWSMSLEQVGESPAWLVIGVMGLVTGLFALMSNRWVWQPVFFALVLLSVVALASVSHNASGGNHDVGTNSMIFHFAFTLFWVGGLMALLGHSRRKGDFLREVSRRYSFVALVSFIALSLSGVVNTWITISFGDLFTSNYGRLILVKIIAIVILGLIGYIHRKVTLPKLDEDPSGSMFRRFAVVEILIMAATIGVAVALGRTPPPPQFQDQAGGGGELPEMTQMQARLGYNLDIPFGWEAMFTVWRFDLFFGTIAIALASVYLYWLYLVKKKGGQWPLSNTIWWLSGCVMLLFTSSSALGVYMPAQFSVHMLAHMMYSMAIPVMLVLGGPVTLAFRALKPAGRDGLPGVREWLAVFINNPVSKFLTHPIVATVQFVAGFYLLYMTSLYAWMAEEHIGHLFMNVHFLISGYLFYWVIVGVDAAPNHTPESLRLLVLMVSLPFHAFFGVALMQTGTVIAPDYYGDLSLPWAVDLLADQNTGGAIAWAVGEIPLYMVTAALFVQWRRSDAKEAKRYDRKADRDHDQELNDYNAMLQGMAEGRSSNVQSEYYTGVVDDEHRVSLGDPVGPAEKRKKRK